MSLRTLQWNIGGGLIRADDADPTNPLSYSIEGLEQIIYTIKTHGPDIITLQEVHSDDDRDQAHQIAEALGMHFVASDVYTPSHLQDGQALGQAICSRFLISWHTFRLFYNPQLETTSPKGERWLSADKGVTSCHMTIQDIAINIKTCHSFPYRRFKVDPQDPVLQPLREDMATYLKPDMPLYLLQGDLNYDERSLRPLYPQLFQDSVQEVLLEAPTTPKGRRYDHVLYRGFRHIQSIVDSSVLTDHFPVISDFDIDQSYVAGS